MTAGQIYSVVVGPSFKPPVVRADVRHDGID
jgi:hypothetical protein